MCKYKIKRKQGIEIGTSVVREIYVGAETRVRVDICVRVKPQVFGS
jgi:hypothetical protein